MCRACNVARGSNDSVHMTAQFGGVLMEESRDASVKAAASIKDDHRMEAGTVSGEEILC